MNEQSPRALDRVEQMTTLSRRSLIHRAGVIGIGAAAAGTLLAACGGSSKSSPTSAATSSTATAATTPAGTTTSTVASAATPAATTASATSTSAAATQASGPSNVSGTLNYAIASDPATVDPAIEVGGPGYRFFLQTYEGLLDYPGNIPNLTPALALSYSAAADGTSIDFKLRPNTKFHDGTTLDAATVKASIERTKAVGKGGSFFLSTLKEVQVVDPMTVRLVATKPSVSLLYGMPKVYITGKAHLSDPDGGAAFFATNVNGTGPYKLTRWDKGQQFVLDQFKDYWQGWSGNHVAQIIERVVPESGTQELLMQKGDIHLAFLSSIGITEDPKDVVAKYKNLQMVTSKAYRVTVISMNSQKGPLKDLKVRQAMQLAFDYEGMVKIYQGYADVPNGFLPKGFTDAYDPSLPPFKQDLAQAKKLLSDAGHPNGGFSLEFVYTETEPQARLAGLLMQSTLQPLGITVNLQGKPFATLASQIANLDTAPDIQATLTMTPRTADPGELLSTVYSGANAGKAYNYGWYKNAQVDQLLAQADQEFDNTKRLNIYRQINKILVDDAASIWAAYPQLVEVMSGAVQNYQYNPLNYTGCFPCYPIWLKQ